MKRSLSRAQRSEPRPARERPVRESRQMKGRPSAVATADGTLAIPCMRAGRGFTIEVRVKPRSSRLVLEGVEGGALIARLTAPPEGGKANEQLIALLSKELGVGKSRIRIIRGLASRTKVVEVEEGP